MKKIYNWINNKVRGHGLSKFPLLISLHSFIIGRISPPPQEVLYKNGHVIFDPCFAFQESFQPFEPFTSELISSLLKRDSVFVDIGANIGWFSLIAAKSGARVSSFEANPDAANTLKKNMQINGYISDIYNVAVGKTNKGKVKLYLKEQDGIPRWDFSSTRLSEKDGYSEKNAVTVPVRTIDSFMGAEWVDLIKMDIEGGEMAALQGMKETLKNNPHITVIAEFTYFDSREGFDYLCEWERLGFSFYRINEKERKIVPQSLSKILHTPKSIRVHSNNILLKR